MNEGTRKEQLQLLWPGRLLKSPPEVVVPEGYEMRRFRRQDAPAYVRLMHAAGFVNWSEAKLREWLPRVVAGGFFVVVEKASGELVATAMATRNPSVVHPKGGELGWVAADPLHAGKGLGLAVCAAVTRRFLETGYRRLYLRTDDYRLPAIKTYLRLGWVPFLFAPDMKERWRVACKELGWPFEPQNWPTFRYRA